MVRLTQRAARLSEANDLLRRRLELYESEHPRLLEALRGSVTEENEHMRAVLSEQNQHIEQVSDDLLVNILIE